MAASAADEEEWAGEDEAWPEDTQLDEEEEEEDEVLLARALPVDGEPDFESVRARSARSAYRQASPVALRARSLSHDERRG